MGSVLWAPPSAVNSAQRPLMQCPVSPSRNPVSVIPQCPVSIVHIRHSMAHSLQLAVRNPHSTMHTRFARSPIQRTHWSFHSQQSIFHNSQSPAHMSQSTVHITHSIARGPQSTFRSPHSPHYTVHGPQSTLGGPQHTTHSPP